MFAYQSTLTVPSQLYKSVTFTIKKPSFARYKELCRLLFDKHDHARQITETFRELGRDPEANAVELLKLDLEAMRLVADINPIWIREGVVSIEGLTIDGEPATADNLCEFGPPDLVGEILQAIRRWGLASARECN